MNAKLSPRTWRFRRTGLICARLEILSTVGLSVLALSVPLGAVRTLAADSHGWLLVDNKGDKTLGIVDPESCKQVAVVEEDGETGHEVVASPDGRRAFVPIYGNSGVGQPGTDGRLIRVIDLEKREVVGTVDFGKGVRPHCAVIGPKNGLLYVTTELENAVTVIDPATLKIIGSVPTGQAESHMLAINSEGRHGYTATSGRARCRFWIWKRKKC